MSTRSMAARIGVITASAAAVSLLAPASAYAGTKYLYLDKKKTVGLATKASGTVKFIDGKTSDRAGWSIRVTDRKRDHWCAQVKVIIDRPGPDRQYASSRACGTGRRGGAWLRFYKNQTATFTFLRGVKIQVCQIEEISNANQKCVTKQYIKNPYYKW